ncbi:MAG: tRNA 2-selenouridine(34) synthase MnmH [Candidatus Cloacimonas sp. 4484_143]|nr:MAG: tRNA 2-selenouridine(34) synthase MnmH [Candidatus Cloacimonas sp. 4484_143]RLC50932.1 MAG: tRNA 2-selenouridine(34) synthase MnmH [Candidatus Cloacimonadota bacterium]RLC51042.1 MAG: tRNA 2-selenouridine(34) synthase MnmH [Candidatus Cloacimonadota bacterium]
MQISIEDFLQKSKNLPIIDVRTPAEFMKGHIPGAINIPIFSNEERAIVGTKYKQESRDTAMAEAMHFVSQNVDFYLDEIAKLKIPTKKILIHCWRGGMRSGSMARLFAADGYDVQILQGGYKSYRNLVLQSFEQPLRLLIIGGMTGSGKSDVLKEIENLGEQIVDLEGIAHHKGSAFGALGQLPQPTVEQFENDLHKAFSKLDLSEPIWLEDESQLVGKVRIPKPLFEQIRAAKVYKLELSKEYRIKRLVTEYTDFDKKLINTSIQNISRRLGGLAAQHAVNAIEKNDFSTAIDIVLSYYDKTYSYGLSKREGQTVIPVKLDEDDPKKTAKLLIGREL